jgi:hypothetical protein
MKILISSANNHRLREADRLGSFGQGMLPAGWPSAHSSSSRLMAVPSVAQEEDRSDMEGADHHGGLV